LGANGNLQFTAREGSTAPASCAGMLLSETSPSFAESRADLEACVTGEPSEVRAQREALVQARVEVRDNSRLIGNLLSSLTVKLDEDDCLIYFNDCLEVAQALKALNVPPSGVGLYSLKGAKYCLDTYMDELKELDIQALRYGVLSSKSACETVLGIISPHSDDELRIQANYVLRDVAQAVDRRVVRRAVHEPLSKVVDLLDTPPVDAYKLCAQLIQVSDDESMLGQYFDSLSVDELKNLRSVVLPGSSNRALQVLSRMAVRSPTDALAKETALTALDRARWPFETAYGRRVEEIMQPMILHRLGLALDDGRRSEVCTLLRQLSVDVGKVLAIFGELPFHTTIDLEDFSDVAMQELRDHQNNPVGPLNEHSLNKLDGDMCADLRVAAMGLSRFGLELESHLHAGAAHR